MIDQTTTITVRTAQTADVCAAEVTWGRLTTPPPPELPADATWVPMPRTWGADGSAKRRLGDKPNETKGRDLATLRALQKLVKRLEDEIGPDAHDAPKVQAESVARQVTADNIETLADWAMGWITAHPLDSDPDRCVSATIHGADAHIAIHAVGGKVRADIGDWVIAPADSTVVLARELPPFGAPKDLPPLTADTPEPVGEYGTPRHLIGTQPAVIIQCVSAEGGFISAVHGSHVDGEMVNIPPGTTQVRAIWPDFR